jgi:hypothetical protein
MIFERGNKHGLLCYCPQLTFLLQALGGRLLTRVFQGGQVENLSMVSTPTQWLQQSSNWNTCDTRNKDVFLKQGFVYEMTACAQCTSAKIGGPARVVD